MLVGNGLLGSPVDKMPIDNTPKAMSKIGRKTNSGAFVTVKAGFRSGVADMFDVLSARQGKTIPGSNRSSSDALRGDWNKLGGDMRRGSERVLSGKR